jgi:RNA polymerase sigma-70 factor (ECF subfamily)
MAYRQAPSGEIAEDWTQETLLRAWKDFHKLNQQVAVYAWLLKILNHVIADDSRREIRRTELAPIYTTEDKILNEHPCASPGPFETIVNQQSEHQMIAMIKSLPDTFRDIILLRDVEGLSYQEIGDILGLAKGTVMSRLSRGRRHLASLIIKSATSDENFSMIDPQKGKNR